VQTGWVPATRAPHAEFRARAGQAKVRICRAHHRGAIAASMSEKNCRKIARRSEWPTSRILPGGFNVIVAIG
jgi:hypothetical protein